MFIFLIYLLMYKYIYIDRYIYIYIVAYSGWLPKPDNVIHSGSTLIILLIEGSLEVKLPAKWADGKAEVGRVREEKRRRDKIREEKVRRKKIQAREKVGTSRFTMFVQWFVAPEGWKVGSLKRRVQSHLARWEMKNCTQLWREAHFQVKSVQSTQHTRLGPLSEVDMSKKCTLLWPKAHFQVKKGSECEASEHFWKLTCRESARCCGARHASKSKC